MKRVIALGSGFMMMVMRGWRSHLLNLLLAEKICCCKQKPNGHLSVRGSWSDKCPRLGQAAPRQGRGQRKVNYHRSQSILSLITLDGTGKANGQLRRGTTPIYNRKLSPTSTAATVCKYDKPPLTGHFQPLSGGGTD